jgi:hypothetical protein
MEKLTEKLGFPFMYGDDVRPFATPNVPVEQKAFRGNPEVGVRDNTYYDTVNPQRIRMFISVLPFRFDNPYVVGKATLDIEKRKDVLLYPEFSEMGVKFDDE